MTHLSNAERQRYARHLCLPEVGEHGQIRLKNAAVLLIGAGGLGSPAALYLAAAGVGTLGIVDFDVVDASNLQRQILHGHSTLGHKKIASAEQRLSDLNPCVILRCYDMRLSSENALSLIRDYDVVIDGSDNFATRYLVNDACFFLGKPCVSASVLRFEGQLSVFDATRGPCYRCLFPTPPPSDLAPACSEAGVLGVLPGVLGTLQASEAIKLILEIGQPLIGRVLLFDGLSMQFRELKLRKNPDCSLCGQAPSITQLSEQVYQCGSTAQTSEKFMSQVASVDISPQELEQLIKAKEITLVDVREPSEWDLGHIAGAIHIPLGEVDKRHNELSKNDTIVLYCRMGGRSMRALNYLRSVGFTRLQNLKGGITAWQNEIDPSIAV